MHSSDDQLSVQRRQHGEKTLKQPRRKQQETMDKANGLQSEPGKHSVSAHFTFEGGCSELGDFVRFCVAL